VATLPATSAGYDIRNALAGGLRLGVSVLLKDVQSKRLREGIEVVTGATVLAISLMRPNAAIYRDPCSWLASPAGTLPSDVEEARRRWGGELGLAVIFVTHDIGVAIEVAIGETLAMLDVLHPFARLGDGNQQGLAAAGLHRGVVRLHVD
jgi:hypothetical protein